MKKLTALLSISTIFASLSLSATANPNAYYDYAKVVKAKPVYEYVRVSRPVQQCYPVDYSHHYDGFNRHHRTASLLTGAAIGGAIGKAIGDSKGSTVAGAIIGGVIGDNHGKRYDSRRGKRRGQRQHVENCETTYSSAKKVRKLKGYKVKYRYRGESFRTFMRQHPGDSVKVRVSLSPVGYDY